MRTNYYYDNSIIKYKDYSINITASGNAYLNEYGTMKKLNSIYFEKSRSMSISLPDGEELRVKNNSGKLEIIEE